MAHALFSALQQLGGHLRAGEMTEFTDGEKELLATYEQGLKKT